MSITKPLFSKSHRIVVTFMNTKFLIFCQHRMNPDDD